MDNYNACYINGSSVDLYNCDCMEYIKNMNDVDIVFTSPPYNRKRNDKYANYDDTLTDYYGFLCNIIDALIPKVKRHIILNVQTNYYNKRDIFKLFGKYSNLIQQVFIWGKTNPMPANGNNITNSYEYFIVIGKKPIKSNTTYTKNLLITSVNSQTGMPTHKAVMKQEVADWFIEKFTKDGDIIYDPFMGLGTTGISCKKFGRKCIGTELCKSYYLTSIGRIEAEQSIYQEVKNERN